MKNNVYQEITEKIIAQLSKGIIPWEQPWFGTRGAISHSTGESYSLLNQMILGGESGEFITWHQIQMLKGRITKGSKGRKVYFWGTIEVGEENEKGERIIKKIPYLRSFTVFRVDDCEGIENRWQSKQGNTATVPPITQAESTTNQYLNREVSSWSIKIQARPTIPQGKILSMFLQ